MTIHLRAKQKISKNVKKIQNKFNNGIIKAFKPSNKAFLGMSDYKWTFLVNGWDSLHVS